MFKIKKILWTGGWDSTFRVLDLVLNKNEKIQPYYVYDNRRKSTEMEIKTMNKIKEMISDVNKEAAQKIAKTKFINLEEIPKNEKITKSFKDLKSQSHLGGQYDWLARYCEDNNIDELELCIHKDDTVEGFIRHDVALVEKENDRFYKLKDNPSQKELSIFSYYNFPLLDMTKLEMEKKAKNSGFGHIMEVTWFCHSPINEKPCGMCNPCKYTREEGLGRRVQTPTLAMKLNRKINSKLRGLKRRLGVK